MLDNDSLTRLIMGKAQIMADTNKKPVFLTVDGIYAGNMTHDAPGSYANIKVIKPQGGAQ